MCAELDYLRQVRWPEVVERLRHAREQRADPNSAEHQEAKDEGAFVQGRIRELESLLAEAKVVLRGPEGTVALGSTVAVVDEDGVGQAYTIVGIAEADPRAHRISCESPVGRALLDRRPGDVVHADTPAGPLRLRIVSVA